MRKTLLFVAISVLLATNICIAQNGVITTFAGNGIHGSSGDGGPANAAELVSPYGIIFDNSGNMYFADNRYGVVRKINTAGIITTIAGTGSTGHSGDGGPATAAQTYASNIAIDTFGNIYIADDYNLVVRKINTSGTISTIAGMGNYIAYNGDGGPATAAQMGRIVGVAVDASGNVYLSDISNNVVRKVNTSGIITTIAGNGVAGYSGDGGAATAAELYEPRGIITDTLGNIYIADVVNNRIRVVNASGIISTIAGNGVGGFSGDGGPATMAEMNQPFYLTTDAIGNIYFTDAVNHRVRKINSAGIISTVVGSGIDACSGIGSLAINASIKPIIIAFDLAQNMYIGEDSCNAIHKVQPNPSISSDSFYLYINKLCNGLNITATANSSSPLNMKISFGDNTTNLNPLSPMGGSETVNVTHSYAMPGTYSIKMVLLNGTNPIDSIFYSYNSLLCNTFPVNFYYDANSNCTKDSNETLNYLPLTIEIDSNSVTIDTVSATSGFEYTAYGNPGDIYSFKVVSTAAGMFASCSGGVVTDTLQNGMYNDNNKNIALSCSSSPAFDLAGYVNTQAGKHLFTGNIIVNNAYCNTASATLTATLDTKYNFVSAMPTPTSVGGNIVTWNLGNMAANAPQMFINFNCEVPGAWLAPGDTVNTSYTVTPISGDINPVNNSIIETNTVTSSYDPNEMAVTPEGYISSGTKLQYTIDFENTGNDTAHNIYVMDTLSSNVIPSSMKILTSSAVMNTIPIKVGPHNIIKFDFPGIQLLDSSHHNQCNGMLIFTINTKSSLPRGTTIFNHAGIFFDDNPVVMTDTVENIIGIAPNNVATVNNQISVQIYPNPATNVLVIDMSNNAYNSYSITNTMGQVLMQQPLTTTQTTIDIKTLPAGLYYITLRGDNGTKAQKFVKM